MGDVKAREGLPWMYETAAGASTSSDQLTMPDAERDSLKQPRWNFEWMHQLPEGKSAPREA